MLAQTMIPQHIQIITVLESSSLCTRYQAVVQGQRVEFCLIQKPAFPPAPLRRLTQQLKRTALTKSILLRGILEMDLECDHPWAILPAWSPWEQSDVIQRPFDDIALSEATYSLLQALSECERLGIQYVCSTKWMGATNQNRCVIDTISPFLNSLSIEHYPSPGEVLDWLRCSPRGIEKTISGHPIHSVIDEIQNSDSEWLRIDEWLARIPSKQTAVGADQTLEYKFEEVQHQIGVRELLPAPSMKSSNKPEDPKQLGRFKIVRKLGQGGMGAVYLARDEADGSEVALKTILERDSEEALQRFHKEARLLAEVQNPYVANLIEINEDQGIPFLAMEFVDGISLAEKLKRESKLSSSDSLKIVADACRALVEPHKRGIVHRDIKPENILLPQGSSAIYAKLTDFGLARHTIESASLNLTKTGTILGTPLYMAPEQCTGKATIDARTDIYALGATLFHCLTGRTVFQGTSVLQLIQQHTSEPAPKLSSIDPSLSEGLTSVVGKCLAKSPGDRYPHANALLEDVERILRGQANLIQSHPRRPRSNGKEPLIYDFNWDLQSTPDLLWPYVSNTERFNRAIGMTPPVYLHELGMNGNRQVNASLKSRGVEVAWEEHPFEWVEGKRFGVLREFSKGPFQWLTSVVELLPISTGTRLNQIITIMPTGLLGKTVAAVEVGIRSKRSMERVYRRIDAVLAGKLDSEADHFLEAPPLSRAAESRLEECLKQLIRQGAEILVVERLGEFIRKASDQRLSRIRPIALARQWNLDQGSVINTFLLAARQGLLVLMWDLLCPLCRIPSDVRQTLKELAEHGRCDACRLDYKLDLAKSVEMIFRVHPDIRSTETRLFCVGGPAHSPHVVSQLRVAPEERMTLDLQLTAGQYRIRGPQLPYSIDFRVDADGKESSFYLDLAHPVLREQAWSFVEAGQRFEFYNSDKQELILRIERTADRTDAFTAARAASLGRFRELFPDEVLQPGQLASIQNVSLMATALSGIHPLYQKLGDGGIFQSLHQHFAELDERIRKHGGAMVKTVNEGLLASFPSASQSLECALALTSSALPNAIASEGAKLKIALHNGPTMAATINDQLDYFGSTVKMLWELLDLARPNEIVLSEAIFASSSCLELLQSKKCSMEFPAQSPITHATLSIPADAN